MQVLYSLYACTPLGPDGAPRAASIGPAKPTEAPEAAIMSGCWALTPTTLAHARFSSVLALLLLLTCTRRCVKIPIWHQPDARGRKGRG